MNTQDVQKYLIQRGFMSGNADGVLNSRTYDAIDSALHRAGLVKINWGPDRKWVAAMQLTARNAGIDTGKIDGLLGPQTRYALEVFDARKKGDTSAENWRDNYVGKVVAEHNVTPKYNSPWEKDMLRHFGKIGTNHATLHLPIPFVLAWEPTTPVLKITVHEKIHDNVREVYLRALDHYGADKFKELRLHYFGGCYNPRKKRGGSSWSMHAWAVAFDHDPDRNQLKWNHTKAEFAKPDYEMWFRLWAEEGAQSLGQLADYDWMHTQFARIQ